MAGRDSGTHATKRVRLPRALIARVKRALADLEAERGRFVSFNEGTVEALNQFAERREAPKETP